MVDQWNRHELTVGLFFDMQSEKKKFSLTRLRFTWGALRDYLLITGGALLQALGLVLFLVPSHLVSGGVSGLVQIIYF